jgi:hypothetical protein
VSLAELAKELQVRHVEFDPGDGVRKCSVALRKNETERFQTCIEIELSQRGKTFMILLHTERITQLKQTLLEKGESDLDISKFSRRCQTLT